MRGARTLCLASVLLALACAKPPPGPAGPVPLAPGDPRPLALLTQLVERADALQGARGSARVKLDGQRGASFARQLVALERPARLRVEVMGLLGQRLAVLATDGERYQLWRAEANEFEEGPVRPSLLLEVSGIPLAPDEAVGLLLGAPRPRLAAGMLRGARLGDGGLRVTPAPRAGAPRASYEFDGAGRLARMELVAADGSATLGEVRWQDWRDAGTLAFPHQVTLDFPSAQTRAEIDWREVELNPELPDAIFRLELPARTAER